MLGAHSPLNSTYEKTDELWIKLTEINALNLRISLFLNARKEIKSLVKWSRESLENENMQPCSTFCIYSVLAIYLQMPSRIQKYLSKIFCILILGFLLRKDKNRDHLIKIYLSKIINGFQTAKKRR